MIGPIGVGDLVRVVKPGDYYHLWNGMVVMFWSGSGVVDVNFGEGHRYQQYYLHELEPYEESSKKP